MVIAVFLASGLGVCFGQLTDWPMLNGSGARTSWASGEDELKPPLQQTGLLSVGGLENTTYADMTWYDHTLCVGINDGGENLYALFDTGTGDTLWTFRVPGSGSGSDYSPAQNDSLVFCGGQDGAGLFALDRMTGGQKWFQSLPSLYCRSPILDNGSIYILDSRIRRLNISDGSAVWSLPMYTFASPAVDEDHCYTCGNNLTSCFHKESSAEIWTQYNSNLNYTTLAIYGDFLYTSTGDSVVAYDKATGAVEWVYPMEGRYLAQLPQNGLAVSDSAVCCAIWNNGDNQGQLLVLNRQDGTYRWHVDFDYAGCYTPLIANGVVYVVDGINGGLFGYDLKTGDLIFSDHSHQYTRQPIAAEHKLYVSSHDGVVVFENIPVTAVRHENRLPAAFDLYQNTPNPFNPETEIRYTLHRASRVDLAVYDVSGRKVFSANRGMESAGGHAVVWSGRDQTGRALPSGVYVCKLTAGSTSRAIRMVLIQ